MRTICAATVLTVLILFGAAPTVQAATLSYSDSIPVGLTDWSDTVTIPQFDPALGTLDSIEFKLTGVVEGLAFYESLEPEPKAVEMTLSAHLSLMRPDLSLIVDVSPSNTVMELAAGYDGTEDFDGPSGSTFVMFSAPTMATTVSPPPASDLTLFTGVGTVDLPVTAFASSFGSGPGNWVFGFITSAGADVMVTYTYTPIPEPATLLVVAAGLIGLRTRRGPRR